MPACRIQPATSSTCSGLFYAHTPMRDRKSALQQVVKVLGLAASLISALTGLVHAATQLIKLFLS